MNKLDPNNEIIIIPFSKQKLAALLLIACCFVTGGFWFVLKPDEFANSGIRNTPVAVIMIIGIITVVFFGAGIVYFIYKLFNNDPGLQIDNAGITINPGAKSSTQINWIEIDKFSINSIRSTNFVGVYLKNPEQFIDSQPDGWKKKLLRFNLKTYGAPLSITSSALNCNFEDLYSLLIKRLKKFKDENKVP